MKNRVVYTFLLTLLVVAGLGALHFLPPLSVGGKPLRKVDLLSDIRIDKPVVVADSDTVAPPVVVRKPAFVDTCRSGMTCIEDYADSASLGMGWFYQALGEAGRRVVRVAYFGDSFIEADILTADLREMLQKRFGGYGVGYVNITTQVAGYRPTVGHQWNGWGSHAITDTTHFDRSRQDLSNHYFIPHAGAYVLLKGQRKYASRLDTCQSSTLYFVSPGEARITALVNGVHAETFRIAPGDSALQALTVHGRIGSVQWKVDSVAASSTFYAATMDPSTGMVVDNFSVRGSSGQQLLNIPVKMLRQYDRLRPYDLIVLQYGLNVASEQGVNYTYYTKAMAKVIAHLQEAFPRTSILLVSVGDREYKDENGQLRTMPGVKNLIRYQQALAADTHIAFWNMFEAMGGEGSIVEMVNAHPQMANYDYTHINFKGGKHIAELLYNALIYGKEQYEKRKAYEGR